MFSIIHLAQDACKKSPYLSETLITHIQATLEKGEKALLYLNKRGSHSSALCRDCGEIWMCKNCDTRMSVHQKEKKLLCHICSSSENIPYTCYTCGGNAIDLVGVGTQHIESMCQYYFPSASVFRFDSDALSSVAQKKKVLSELQNADIIIGTKMLTTGFNFQKVGCIGIILVESEIQGGVFNAQEKALQNLKQLIGRGNRKKQKTEIILQTFDPQNILINYLTQKSTKQYIQESLTERKAYNYPPFKELVHIETKHSDEKKAIECMHTFLQTLKSLPKSKEAEILYGENCFKKHKLYHSRAIVKCENIHELFEPLRNEILKNSYVQIYFSQ